MPSPAALPVIRPGLYTTMVPLYEISIWEPLVTASRRRRNEISWGARPGFDGELERIWEMWTGLPVRVARTRRYARFFCDVRRTGGWERAILM